MPSPTTFTDYLTRLLDILDFVKQAVAMNDDVFDFFSEALPGYEEVDAAGAARLFGAPGGTRSRSTTNTST